MRVKVPRTSIKEALLADPTAAYIEVEGEEILRDEIHFAGWCNAPIDRSTICAGKKPCPLHDKPRRIEKLEMKDECTGRGVMGNIRTIKTYPSSKEFMLKINELIYALNEKR